MTKTYNPESYVIYTNELVFSSAFQELSKAARNLLHCFLAELKYSRPKENKIEVLNNGKLVVTEKQFRALFHYSKSTYKTAKNRLIEVGFLECTHMGGEKPGDFSTYKLLYCPFQALTRFEEKWKDYPEFFFYAPESPYAERSSNSTSFKPNGSQASSLHQNETVDPSSRGEGVEKSGHLKKVINI